MRKIMKIIAITLIFIISISTSCFAGQVAYKSGNNIVIKESVFNELVTESKLLEVYKKESEILKNTVEDLKKLNEEQKIAYENKINNLQMQLDAKDSVIALYKDSELKYKQLEALYNTDKATIRKMKIMNTFEKIAVIGLTVFGCIAAEDTSNKIGIGVTGAAITLMNW